MPKASESTVTKWESRTDLPPSDRHKVAKVFNRPGLKAKFGDDAASQPDYTPAEVAARDAFGLAIATAVESGLDKIGAFLTPNNKNDGMLLALTMPCPPIRFIDPTGKVLETRQFNLTINAPLAKERKASEDAAQPEAQVAMTYEDIMASITKTRQGK